MTSLLSIKYCLLHHFYNLFISLKFDSKTLCLTESSKSIRAEFRNWLEKKCLKKVHLDTINDSNEQKSKLLKSTMRRHLIQSLKKSPHKAEALRISHYFSHSLSYSFSLMELFHLFLFYCNKNT